MYYGISFASADPRDIIVSPALYERAEREHPSHPVKWLYYYKAGLRGDFLREAVEGK